MAEIESAEVTVVLSQVFSSTAPFKLNQLHQVLADLVQGEFQQLETKEDEGQVRAYFVVLTCFQSYSFQERFEHYLTKSFNKTASLMAHTCHANGKCRGNHCVMKTAWVHSDIVALLAGVEKELLRDAFLYGRNIGRWMF